MIAFVRQASIAAGKTASAIGFAIEIAAFLKKQFDIDVEVMMPVGGNPQRVAWATRYKDLGTLEATTSKMLADPAYMALVTKGAENFIAGSLHDSIWRTL